MTTQVGLDTQCLSFVIDAMASTFRPSKKVGEQQLALIRCFFYLPETLWVTPIVTAECAQIRDIDLATLHQSFIHVLFGELPIRNHNKVTARIQELNQCHSGVGDCTVLAEAEDVGHNVLLSFDAKFRKRLSHHAKGVEIVEPKAYWESLCIPKGIKPNKVPHPSNPLATQTWWQW